jgi:hypothetical protein
MESSIDKTMPYELTKVFRNRLLNDKDLQDHLFDICLELWDDIIDHYPDEIKEDADGIYDAECEFVPSIAGVTIFDEMRGEYLYVPLNTVEFNYVEHLNDIMGDIGAMLETWHENRNQKASA